MNATLVAVALSLVSAVAIATSELPTISMPPPGSVQDGAL